MPLPHTIKLLLDRKIYPLMASQYPPKKRLAKIRRVLKNHGIEHEYMIINNQIVLFIKVDGQIYKIKNIGVKRIAVLN